MISKAIVGEFARLPLLVNTNNSNKIDNEVGNIVLGQSSPARSNNNNSINNNNDDSKATVLIK